MQLITTQTKKIILKLQNNFCLFFLSSVSHRENSPNISYQTIRYRLTKFTFYVFLLIFSFTSSLPPIAYHSPPLPPKPSLPLSHFPQQSNTISVSCACIIYHNVSSKHHFKSIFSTPNTS